MECRFCCNSCRFIVGKSCSLNLYSFPLASALRLIRDALTSPASLPLGSQFFEEFQSEIFISMTLFHGQRTLTRPASVQLSQALSLALESSAILVVPLSFTGSLVLFLPSMTRFLTEILFLLI